MMSSYPCLTLTRTLHSSPDPLCSDAEICRIRHSVASNHSDESNSHNSVSKLSPMFTKCVTETVSHTCWVLNAPIYAHASLTHLWSTRERKRISRWGRMTINLKRGTMLLRTPFVPDRGALRAFRPPVIL